MASSTTAFVSEKDTMSSSQTTPSALENALGPAAQPKGLFRGASKHDLKARPPLLAKTSGAIATTKPVHLESGPLRKEKKTAADVENAADKLRIAILSTKEQEADIVKLIKDLYDSREELRLADPDERDCFTGQDSKGNGILQLAALNGRTRMVGLLIAKDSGFDINGVDRNHGTALQAAIYYGQMPIVELLLKHTAIKVNTKGGYFGCALQVAYFKHDEITIDMILAKPAVDVDIVAGKFAYPIIIAATMGRKAVVEKLLSHSKDKSRTINFNGGQGGNALQAAAAGPVRPGYLYRIVNSHMIEELATKDGPEGKPITITRSVASEADTNHAGLAEYLLSNGAIFYFGSGRYKNAINAAAISGRKEILDVILKGFLPQGPLVSVPKVTLQEPNDVPDTETPLPQSEPPGEDASLPHTGPSEEQLSVLNNTMVSVITTVAATNHSDMVQRLLSYGANINFRTEESWPRTPLEMAAQRGLEHLVQFFLGYKPTQVDIHAESGIHGTALRSAIANMKPKSAELLIHQQVKEWGLEATRGPIDPLTNTPGGTLPIAADSVDPVSAPAVFDRRWEISDDKYGNILHLATLGNMGPTARLLLEHHADPNVVDTTKKTALHIACWFGCCEIVKLLVDEFNAKIFKDISGDTPRDEAVKALSQSRAHPGPERADLEKVLEMLPEEKKEDDDQNVFFGPGGRGVVDNTLAKPVFKLPAYNPGFGFEATIVDIFQEGDQEILHREQVNIDNVLVYLRKSVEDSNKDTENIAQSPPIGADPHVLTKESVKPSTPTTTTQTGQRKRKLRWVHLPANNMTWAENLINEIENPDRASPFKSLWGIDPYYTSPDLAFHARCITPQCGKLIPAKDTPDKYKSEIPQSIGDSTRDHPISLNTKMSRTKPEPQGVPKPSNYFMALPYVHWETDHAQRAISGTMKRIEQNITNPLFTRFDTDRTAPQNFPVYDREEARLQRETSLFDGLIDESSTSNSQDDNGLLTAYLPKTKPLHPRRTLDQYYYSHLADTSKRDGDQVVMRKRNRSMFRRKLNDDMFDLWYENWRATRSKSRIRRKLDIRKKAKSRQEKSQRLRWRQKGDKFRDDYSPIVMVDQLWLWTLDNGTIITCFPNRRDPRSLKVYLDLDKHNVTDVLKAVLLHLRSKERLPINHSYELAEIIITQSISILHHSKVPEGLDFLQEYSMESCRVADRVAAMLTGFVQEFKDFMSELKQQHIISEDSLEKFEDIFSVIKETSLLRDIQDLKDELTMLSAVSAEQIEVLTTAGNDLALANPQDDTLTRSQSVFTEQSQKHLKQVQRMLTQTAQAYKTLRDLLNLKQQQASMLEARVSRTQAISSGKQSQTIMMFTIVTIIFLPLTFLTTIFQLPIAEFPRIILPKGGTMPDTPYIQASYVVKYIGSITLGVAIPFVIIAWKITWIRDYFDIVRNWIMVPKVKESSEPAVVEEVNLMERKERSENDSVPRLSDWMDWMEEDDEDD